MGKNSLLTPSPFNCFTRLFPTISWRELTKLFAFSLRGLLAMEKGEGASDTHTMLMLTLILQSEAIDS